MDYSQGYVGCIRGFQVSGVLMDLRGKVERGDVTYGVSAGKCMHVDLRICTSSIFLIHTTAHSIENKLDMLLHFKNISVLRVCLLINQSF